MMKLTLVAEGMIPAEAALGWLRNGFPIVFEGLLSVILNERAMIEDTVSAVEGLRLYQVRCVVILQKYLNSTCQLIAWNHPPSNSTCC
jgi:hypothetical protein